MCLKTIFISTSDIPYIRRISKKGGAAWDEYEDSFTGTKAKEDAEGTALDIFGKVMIKLLVKGANVNAECTSPGDSEGYYTIDVEESINGIPTGNKAGITVSKKGVLVGGVFLKGERGEHRKNQWRR